MGSNKVLKVRPIPTFSTFQMSSVLILTSSPTSEECSTCVRRVSEISHTNGKMFTNVVSCSLLLCLIVLDCLRSHPETFNASRHTAIYCGLQDHFSYLFFRCSVIQGTSHVRSKFGGTILATKHCDIEEGTCLELEARTCPNPAPAGFCN